MVILYILWRIFPSCNTCAYRFSSVEHWKGYSNLCENMLNSYMLLKCIVFHNSANICKKSLTLHFLFFLYFTIIKLRSMNWKLCKLKCTSVLPQLSWIHYRLQDTYANHHLPNTILDLFMYSFGAFSLIFLSIPWKYLLKFKSHITLWSFSLTVVREGTYYKCIIGKSKGLCLGQQWHPVGKERKRVTWKGENGGGYLVTMTGPRRLLF